MADESIKVEVEGDLVEYLEELGVNVDKTIAKALLDAALYVEGELREEVMNTFSKGGTGALARSFKAQLLEDEGSIKRSGAYSDLVYARIQDEGGRITPKTRKHLAIPLSQEAKVPGKWPRTWAPRQLFRFTSKRGNKLLGERQGTKIKTHYLLRESVRLDGKGYIERARRNAEAGIRRVFENSLRAAIDTSGGGKV